MILPIFLATQMHRGKERAGGKEDLYKQQTSYIFFTSTYSLYKTVGFTEFLLSSTFLNWESKGLNFKHICQVGGEINFQ